VRLANSTAAALRKNPTFPLTPSGGAGASESAASHYFAGTADEALSEWLRVKDYLLNGRTPPPRRTEDDDDFVTLADVINKFLEFKEHLRDTGELDRPQAVRSDGQDVGGVLWLIAERTI
jgi:hypothetical protein